MMSERLKVNEVDYDTAMAAPCVGGNWYFYNVNGFLGRIGRRQAARLGGGDA